MMKTSFKIEQLVRLTLWLLLTAVLSIYLFFYKELVYHSSLPNFLWISIMFFSILLIWLRYNQGEKITGKRIVTWVVIISIFGTVCLLFSKYYFRPKAELITKLHQSK